MTGCKGDTLKLSSNQIPAVGSKSSQKYKAGSWNVTPSISTAITKDTTYTYTYKAKSQKTKKTKLTVTAKNQNVNFGETISQGKYKIKGLASGDKAKVTLTANKKTYEITPKITIKRGNKDVTSSYKIRMRKGKITVRQAPILKVTAGKTGFKASWEKVEDADGYMVYAGYGAGGKEKLVATVTGNKTLKKAITKLNKKAIEKKKPVKFHVIVYKNVDGKKVTIKSSITAHAVSAGQEWTSNAKAVKASKKSYALKVGGTAKIKARVLMADSGKTQLSKGHARALRYVSDNSSVATVDSSGKITAKAKGSCKIYVYAVNGAAKKISVKVK